MKRVPTVRGIRSPRRSREARRPLTQKQEDILAFILDSVAEVGRFPSYREIGLEFGLQSVATVAQHLRALVDKGFLVREGRRLRPPPDLRRERGIPVVGRIAAGRPISAIEHVEGHLNLDAMQSRGAYAVRVVGDSMIGDGILEGDYVVVLPADTAANGELVVAYLGEEQEATVKRFRRAKGRVELHPANPKYRPMVVDRQDPCFRLGGRVIGLVRTI